jgi:CRISPR-associated protein Cas5a/b/c
MIGFIVDTEFSWGFQANVVGLSKTPPSFYYPPPTTFLGALSETFAKEYNLGESKGRTIMQELGKKLLAIGVKPVNCLPVRYEDINRIIAVKRTGGILYPNPVDLTGSFDSPARGKTFLMSLDEDAAPQLRWFLVFKDLELELMGTKFIVSEDQFWKIHRLGSKESRVSVVDVKNIKDFEIERMNGVIETTYSFPVKKVKILKEETPKNWTSETYINPFNFSAYPLKDYLECKNLVVFKVPLIYVAEEEYYCRVEAEAYKYKEEVVVGWSE